jgi:hypothetical protein
VTSYKPENGNAVTSAPLEVVLSFSQPVVVPGASLTVRLVDMELSTFKELTLTPPKLGVVSHKLSLDFADETKPSTLYSLVIDPGLVTDVEGNRFVGLLPGNYQFRMAPKGAVEKDGAAADAAAEGEFPVLIVIIIVLCVIILCCFCGFVYVQCGGIQQDIQQMGIKRTISGRLRRDYSGPSIGRSERSDVSRTTSTTSRMSLWSNSIGAVYPFRSASRTKIEPQPPGSIPDKHEVTHSSLHGAAKAGPADRPPDDGGVHCPNGHTQKKSILKHQVGKCEHAGPEAHPQHAAQVACDTEQPHSTQDR